MPLPFTVHTYGYVFIKKDFDDFTNRYKSELQRDDWDGIFRDKYFVGLISTYSSQILYDLYVLNFDFLDYITSITPYLFYGCGFITSMVTPEHINRVDDYAFAFCGGLESITFLNRKIVFGHNVFKSCNSLKNINVAEGVMIDRVSLGLGDTNAVINYFK